MNLSRWKYGSLAIIICIMVMTACNQQDRTSENDPLAFYYYPALNVYYSPDKNQFYYTIDGGTTWQRKTGDPQIAATLDEKVSIQSEVPDVWQDNAEHRKQYRGTSIDYTASMQAPVSEDPTTNITEKAKPKDTGVVVEPEQPEERREKGLKKLGNKIKRLFKGKDKE